MAVPSKITAAETRLSALPAPPTTGWTAAPRAAALARLRATGLPVRRDEYWRYTDPAALTAAEALAEPVPVPGAPMFDGLDRLRLTFVNGVFDPAQSDDPALAGVEISLLSAASAPDIHWARELYGTLEARGQTPVERPLAALNTAFATEGVLIRATAGATRPVSLVYLQTSATSDVMLHHVIRLEPGADLTLLENGPAGARANIVIEADLARDAAFHHVRSQGREAETLVSTQIFARLAEGARFKSFTMTAGGRLTRNECVLELAGEHGIAHVAGIALGRGGFHEDDTVFITHAAPDCESRQVFKKVLRSGATGVFQGKILVKPGAQKTDGYQISQALLLDDDATFLAKPELEIYADDVQCSHGSTSGAIDETALYYLRSRGVPKAQAEDLLVEAFLAEAIEEIDDPAVAEHVSARLSAWLKRQR